MKPRLALAVIGDEIGPSLSEMLSFCDENGVRRLDMRTVDGRNLLGMTLDEVNVIGSQLRAAGITVPTFVSPLLKWSAPGKAPAGGKVDFAFDPATCPNEDALAHAFDIAIVLGARRIRLFSFLRYPGFVLHDLDVVMGLLMDLAGRSEVIIELENEPVCNIGSLAELSAYFAAFLEETSLEVAAAPQREPPWRLFRPLVDIGNSWSMGHPPSDADIAIVGPMVDLIHLKDRDFDAGRTVPLGDGKVPWVKELTRLLSHVRVAEVVASIETHCPHDARNATAKSVAALRRIAGEIGVEIV